jgi:hypothetical protein
MEEIRPGEAAKSPFLKLDIGRNEDLREVADRLEGEFESISRGLGTSGLIGDELANSYNFQEAIDPDKENPWLNKVVVFPEKNVKAVTDYAEDVASELEDGDYRVEIVDFGMDDESRRLAAGTADAEVRFNDREERQNNVRLRDGDRVESLDLDYLDSALESMEFGSVVDDSGSSYTHEVEVDGKTASIKPDLLTGWFDVEAGFDPSYNARVWMPYAEKDSAILVRGKDNGDGFDVESQVITDDSSRTGDFFMDAMSEARQHYSPFWGILTPQISGEAVEFYSEETEIDPRVDQPRDIEIRQKAINQLDDHKYDSEVVRDILYKKASRENPNGLYVNGDGHREQLGRDENYLRWNLEGDDIVMHELYDSRSDAVPTDDRT